MGGDVLESLDGLGIRYQPIVSMMSLRVHGFEALTRPGEGSAFPTIVDLFDHAAAHGRLASAETEVIRRVIERYAPLSFASEARLFCNLDNRVFDDPTFDINVMADAAVRHGLPESALCLEVSERQAPKSIETLQAAISRLLKNGARVAIDDFGQGYSGLHLLVQVQPHYVKIDRFFIDGLAADLRKQAVVSELTALAHRLGFLTVAEGIETEADFRAARDIGCDLAQGYLIARPTAELSQLRMSYDAVRVSQPASTSEVRDRLMELVEPLPTVQIDASLSEVIEFFSKHSAARLVAITDRRGQPLGAIYEADVRPYVFNRYGHALLANKGVVDGLYKLMKRCPVSDIGAPLDAIIGNFALAEGTEGLILTEDGEYLGILSSPALIRLASEREVAAARDQNPLTRLPGNSRVAQYLADATRSGAGFTAAHLDLNHFKAFNDTYGFAHGDRALLLFADLLSETRRNSGAFVAHIGGDDFFIALQRPAPEALAIIEELLTRFAGDAAGLHSAEDRLRGGIVAVDRAGSVATFPLLRASAAVVAVPCGSHEIDPEMVTTAMAHGKRGAKRSPTGLSFLSLTVDRDSRPSPRLLDRISDRLSMDTAKN